jgi:hypothetical protein
LTDDIEHSIIKGRHAEVLNKLMLSSEKRNLEMVKEIELAKQERMDAEASTRQKELILRKEHAELKQELEVISVKDNKVIQELESEITALQLKDLDAQNESKFADKQRIVKLQIEYLQEYTKSIDPKLSDAIKSMGNTALSKILAERLPTASGEVGHLLGLNGLASLKNLVKGTILEEGFNALDSEK